MLTQKDYGLLFFQHLKSVRHIFWSKAGGARFEYLWLYHDFAWHYRAANNVQTVTAALARKFDEFVKAKIGRGDLYNDLQNAMLVLTMPSGVNDRVVKMLENMAQTVENLIRKEFELTDPSRVYKTGGDLSLLRVAARRSLQFNDGFRIVFASDTAGGKADRGIVDAFRLGTLDGEPDGRSFPPLTLVNDVLEPLLSEHASLLALAGLDVKEVVDFYEAVFDDAASTFINLLAGNIAVLKDSEKWMVILYGPVRNTGKTFALRDFARVLTTPTIVTEVVKSHNSVRKHAA